MLLFRLYWQQWKKSPPVLCSISFSKVRFLKYIFSSSIFLNLFFIHPALFSQNVLNILTCFWKLGYFKAIKGGPWKCRLKLEDWNIWSIWNFCTPMKNKDCPIRSGILKKKTHCSMAMSFKFRSKLSDMVTSKNSWGGQKKKTNHKQAKKLDWKLSMCLWCFSIIAP